MATLTTADEAAMTSVARGVLGMSVRQKHSDDEAFRGSIGAPIFIEAVVWNVPVPTIDARGAMPKHLLWVLVFSKCGCSATAVHCRITNWPDPEMFCKWCWCFLDKTSNLEEPVIVLDNRFKDWDQQPA